MENYNYDKNMSNQTFDAIVKVMDRGLVVIPKNLRDNLGLTKNSYVTVKKTSDGLLIKPLSGQVKKDDAYIYKGLKIYPAKIKSKKEKLKILAKTKGIWSEKDYRFWKKGRKEIEKRMEKIDKLEPYWK